MRTLYPAGFLLLALVHLTATQAVPELLEGSGYNGEETTPSWLNDYVICDDDRAQELKDDSTYYDDDAVFSIPNVAIEDETKSIENVTLVELADESLVLKAEARELQEHTAVTEDEELDDDQSSGEGDDIASSIKLIKSPKIYNLPDSEPLEERFAAFTEDNPEENVLMSPNYPEPYPSFVNSYNNYTVTGGIEVKVTIHDMDLDPTTDFLVIRGGSVNDTDEKGPVLTGPLKTPMVFVISHTTTFSVHFVSQHNDSEQTHKGFRLTYAPSGTVVSPTVPTTTEMIVPREELQWVRKQVSISKTMLISVETWPLVKMALTNATNAFIEQNKLKYQPSRPEDIRILAQKCPDTWPRYEECLTLEFAVPLRPIVVQFEDESEILGFDTRNRGYIPMTTTEEPETEYQLSAESLDRMWNDFGAMALAEVGIEVYKMPENSAVLWIWIAISLCIIAAFIFVLYSIWKIDFFKDYRRISKMSRETQDEDRSELKKKEFDISMFPSPHQIVPSLFPPGDPYEDRNPEAQYAYDNATVNPWAEDQNQPRYGGYDDNPSPQVQQKQQVFEPLSPLDYSPSIVDFNEIPEPRSPRRSRNNPFLSPSDGGGGFNQLGPRS